MKQTSGPVFNEIRKSHVNHVVPVATAEWNMNQYYRAFADNTPSEDTDGYDVEMFPIESIVKPNRPRAGIAKAIVGESFVAPTRYSSVPSTRYYINSVDDVYKYWQSPETSDSLSFIEKCIPRIEYCQEAVDPDDEDEVRVGLSVRANKVALTFETAYARPTEYLVQIKATPSSSWTTVATNVVVPNDGRVEVYYNGSTWVTNKPTTLVDTEVHAIRANVTKMSKANSYCNLIEICALLEIDISDDIITENDDADFGETDFITPMGTLSSNTGSISLANEHGLYTNTNEDSVLYGLLDKGVKIDLKYHYYLSDNYVQQFVLYSDIWTEGLEETTVTLVDNSRLFMDTKPAAVLLRNVPAHEVVWRLCDMIGFSNYVVDTPGVSDPAVIDIFWTTGEETAWEVFQDLTRGTQIAVYFDSYGRLRVKTRNKTFNTSQSSTWTLRENASGEELPDIVSASVSSADEANKVTVSYQPTGFSEAVGNIVPFEIVWEPDTDVVSLRASDLVGDLLADHMDLTLSPAQASVWPWKGIAQVEGELIRYEGKRYRYYNGNNKSYKTIYSQEDREECDNLSPAGKRHLNGFTGNLVITERGLWNTEVRNHKIDLDGWFSKRVNWAGGGPIQTVGGKINGVRHNRSDSTVTLSSADVRPMTHYLHFFRGNGVSEGWRRIGTRMKFEKGYSDRCGGIQFNAQDAGGAYFVELMTTSRMDGKMRSTRNELIFYSRRNDGEYKRFGGTVIETKDKSKDNKKGAVTRTDVGERVPVVENRYFELDIYFNPENHAVSIWFDGRLALQAVVPVGWRNPWVSRFGPYARGHSAVTVEYMYGLTKEIELYTDQETFMDRINDGYYSGQWERDYVYQVRDVKRRIRKKWYKVQQKYNQRFFDEFGPIAHEVREFDVKFNTDGMPVLQSKLFHSNTTQAVCTEFVGGVSGAKFVMANTSRQHAVVNGDDSLSAKGEGTIEQRLFVYGRPVIQKDAEQVVREDAWAIRRRGLVEIEYQSKWIQNEASATALADWLTKNWSRNDSVMEVEAYGNPLIELGDVVRVQYQDITTDTKWFVVGINTSFENGITTSLRLRKCGV